MKAPMKKLNLNQETLRNLTENDLRTVVGGFVAPTFTCKCTCEFGGCTCPPPKN